MKKLFIIVTVPVVVETWFKGQAKFLSQYYDVEIITANSNKIDDIENYEGVPIKIFDFTRQINLFKDLKVLMKLYFYILKSRPFIVYTLTPKAGLLGMIASWMSRVPNRIHNVVGLPHLEANGIRKIILETTEKITYFFATKVYCNSFNLKNIIENITNKKIAVIANGSVNGVDIEYFNDILSQQEKKNILDSLKFSEKDFIITYIGRIVKDKGINELINAFEILNSKYSNIRLLLIGDYKNETDPISEKNQRIIHNNQYIKYIEFQNDVRKYLSITTVFVLPSYREGLPNVLIEAGSYGVPVIATDINGCNEIIENNKNGILVKKKDVKSLVAAIEKLINDKDFYLLIKHNIRRSIVQKYEQNYFWEQLLQSFKKIENE